MDRLQSIARIPQTKISVYYLVYLIGFTYFCICVFLVVPIYLLSVTTAPCILQAKDEIEKVRM